jgi:hypothetical protein
MRYVSVPPLCPRKSAAPPLTFMSRTQLCESREDRDSFVTSGVGRPIENVLSGESAYHAGQVDAVQDAHALLEPHIERLL